MAQIETWYIQDLKHPVKVHYLHGNVFSQDNQANIIGVNVFNDGTPAALVGGVSASIVRSDGATVAAVGTLSGNQASVVIPAAAYAVPGVISIAIKITNGGVVTTLCVVVANVYQTQTDAIVDPGTIIPSVQDLIYEIEEAIDSIPADYSALLETLTVKSILIQPYEIRGKFISDLGVITTTSGTYAYASPVPVKRDKKYTFTGTGTTQIAAISTCDQYGGNISPLFVYAQSDTEETFVYIPENDGYIVISYNYSDAYSLTSIDDIVGEVTEQKKNLVDLSSITIGKNWTGADAVDRAIVDVLVEPNKEYIINVPVKDHIWGISVIEKDGFSAGSLKATTINNGGQVAFKTTDKTTRLIVQFNANPDGYAFSAANFTNYPVFVYPFVYQSDYTAVDTKSRFMFGIKDNMIDISNIEIGKNWTGGSASDRAVIAVPINPNAQYTLFAPNSQYWANVSIVQKQYRTGDATSSKTILTGNEFSFISDPSAYWAFVQFNGNTTITSEMFANYDVLMYPGLSKYEVADNLVRDSLLGWKGKKFVWLGTSIPAAGKYGLYNRFSYPAMVGDILHADVRNESVGSSAVHCKTPSRITANNPYGFMSNFEAVSRCITNSLDEMEYIIEHYNDPNIFTSNVPESLSDDDKNFIRSCSWEIKLQQYFAAGKFPDVWVFDHGHNDNPSEASEATYTARTELQGNQNSGYYSDGEYVSSENYSYIEYDVSGVKEVWISGTISAGCDVFDLFDESENLLSHVTTEAQRAISGYFVDTSEAAVLRVSTGNANVNTITTVKYTYGSMYDSLYSYQGGMDFLIAKIKEYNPKARIVIIGEYENQKFPLVSHYQKLVADRWEFPLYRQWENLGLSQQIIKIDGVWTPMLNAYIPDGLHPHTDDTGLALRMMAENIAAWFETIR